MQFEKDIEDPYNIDEMIRDATGGKAGNKRYGMQDSEERGSKRARVDDDDE